MSLVSNIDIQIITAKGRTRRLGRTRYSVSRLNEPKGSYAKYKFDFRSKFILQPSWSAKFILRPSFRSKFILRFDFLNITVLYSIGKRPNSN